MVGAEMTLTHPTPMQWQTLQEALVQHQKHIDNEGSETSASISAAPLVALMDDYTSGHIKGGRYATIAAVVGMSQSEQNSASSDEIVRNEQSLAEKKVRLVGVGRASLKNFFYRVAMDEQSMDEEGYIELDEEDDRHTQVVMANVRLLLDQDARNIDAQRKGHAAYSSHVHAINAMANLANKISRVHEDRQKLVAGLQAAKARLQFSGARELEDYDGLGMLMAKIEYVKEMEATQPLIDQLLNDYSKPLETGLTTSSLSTAEAELRATNLADMENWGMGYTSSLVTSIPQLTNAWVEKLSPYYSPTVRESEEHYYEVLSFVCMCSMEKFLDPRDMGWSLRCTNTIDRLEQAYYWMYGHARQLKDEAQSISRELTECGEECTDLW